MQVQLLKAKLHRVEVTQSDLNYEGSMAIDEEYLEMAGILPYEKILIVNNNNGSRIETYAIPAPRGSRTFCLNGAAARSGLAGDLVTIMVFGLYTRFGNLTGGWCALIFGSGTTLLGMMGQRNWAKHIYPFLESRGWVDGLDHFLRAVSSPFHPWIEWKADPVTFPINSYELLFIASVLAIVSYIIASFIRYKPFDLDKLLHRGKYADSDDLEAQAAGVRRNIPCWKLPLVWCKMLLGIDRNYTKGDKIIAWSVFLYSFVYSFLLAFVGVCAWNKIRPWTQEGWNTFFFYNELVIPGILGIVSTVWMGIGGFMDMKALFRDLAKRVDDPEDNGMV